MRVNSPVNNCEIFLVHVGIEVNARTYCLAAKLYLTLCNPMDCSLQGSSVHGIYQARILEWVAISFSRGSYQPRDITCVSYIGRAIFIFTTASPGKPSARTSGVSRKDMMEFLQDLRKLSYQK